MNYSGFYFKDTRQKIPHKKTRYYTMICHMDIKEAYTKCFLKCIFSGNVHAEN